MKGRALLLAMVVLSLAVVPGCTSQQPGNRQPVAATDCIQPSSEPLQIDLTISYDKAKTEFTIDGIRDVYLKYNTGGNKVRWRVTNNTTGEVDVTINTFVNVLDSTDTKPFPTTEFKIMALKNGDNKTTKDSEEVPSYGKCKTYKYKITFTLRGITGLTGLTTLVLDPRLVVGD